MLNKQFYKALLFCLFIFPAAVLGQSLNLAQCYESAQQLSPVAQQKLYYQSIAGLKVSNANKLNLPMVRLAGQFTYQSDVFTLPNPQPGTDIPEIPKDQYQLSVGLNQKIYDGGVSKYSRQLAEAESEANQQQVEVELYQIKEVINQLYFGTLITQENIKILESVQELLNEQLLEVESQVRNGVILASNANIVKKQVLSTQQQLIALNQDKRQSLDMLAEWIGTPLSEDMQLEIPELKRLDPTTVSLNRPEMQLFELRKQQILASRNLASISNYPRISAFVNGGVGRPNPYNFFETDLNGFYITGVKLEWPIPDWGKKKNELKLLDLQNNIIDSELADFERNLSISLIRERSEILKLEALVVKDQEILALQLEIVQASYSQLQNGLITSTQYITEVNNETQARITTNIHELSLVQAKVDLLTKSGNY